MEAIVSNQRLTTPNDQSRRQPGLVVSFARFVAVRVGVGVGVLAFLPWLIVVAASSCATEDSVQVGARGQAVAVVPAVDDVIPLTGELVRAWNADVSGRGARLRDVLRDAGLAGEGPDGLAAPTVLTFLVRTADLPACGGPPVANIGVVVDDPPRMVGCGVQDLAAVAAFAIAANRVRGATIQIVDDDVLQEPSEVKPGALGGDMVWTLGGMLLGGIDRDVLDVEVVDVGVVDIEIRVDGPLDDALVAYGAVLAWRGPASIPEVLKVREHTIDSSPWAALRRLMRNPGDEEAAMTVHASCHSLHLPTSSSESQSTARVRCTYPPGMATVDVVDGLLRRLGLRTGLAPGRVRLQVVATTPPTSTSMDSPLAVALRTRLANELPRVAVVPALRREVEGPCVSARAAGMACLGTAPLSLHRVERARRGAVDERVGVIDVLALASRVVDIAASAVGDVAAQKDAP